MTDRERGAPADARLFVREQPERSGGGGGGNDGGRLSTDRRPAAAGGDYRRRRIAKHALILQPENPRHLLLDAWASRLDRRRGGTLAHAPSGG